MTDEILENSEPFAQSTTSLFDQPENHDWLLAWLVQQAEMFGIQTPVTLMAQGFTISGLVVNGKRYFELLQSGLLTSKGDQPIIQEALANSFEQFGSLYPEPMTENDKISQQKPTYIHLENTQFFIGGNLVSTKGAPWRGKISSIDGFTIGSLQVS